MTERALPLTNNVSIFRTNLLVPTKNITSRWPTRQRRRLRTIWIHRQNSADMHARLAHLSWSVIVWWRSDRTQSISASYHT